MPKFTDHLKGLAELEDNAGKEVAFYSAAIAIETLQKQLDELKASIPKIKADAVRDYGRTIGLYDSEYDDQEYIEVSRYSVKEYANQLEGKE